MRIDGNKFISECTTYDFKRDVEEKKVRSWLKSVSAFANTEGGTLYFGVDDDANIVGVDNPQHISEFISEKINAHLDPVPTFSLSPKKTDDGKVLIELTVGAGDSVPYFLFLDGSRMAYIRKGNESVAANSHELYKLVLKGSHRSWDSLVTNEPRAKYSFAYLQTEYNERSGAKWEENLLLSFGLVTENGFMTNAGLLFADICPIRQSRLFCTRWDGTEKGDTINDSEYQGNLLINLRMAKDFVKANTATPWFKLPDYRLNLPEYSERAIEEMCVNHLIHRDYTELGAEVSINIYDDRIETTSPGGITSSFYLEKLNPSRISSQRRNPVIAEVFSQLNYMEKRGSGLRKIQKATSMLPTYKVEKEPFFESSRDFFFTTIPNVNYGMTQVELANFAGIKPVQETYPTNEKHTQEMGNLPKKPTQETYPRNGQIAKKPVGKTAQLIIDLLIQNPSATRAEIARSVGKAEDTVKLHLKNLQNAGIIERVGATKNGYWRILKQK